MSSSPIVIVSPKKQPKTPPPPIASEGLDAVTPFLRAVVSGSVCASWCAGVLSGLCWKALRPFIVAFVTVGGFVFGIVLWVCAVAGVLSFCGWFFNKGSR
jgi:hypothetical protein